MFKSKKKHQPKRFDVNRTMAHTGGEYRAPTYGELNRREDKSNDGKKKIRIPRFGWKKALLILFAAILIPLVFVLYIGIWDYHNYSHASKKMFGSGNLVGALLSNNLKNDDGRTNVLLAGFSADDPNHGGSKLTDSIMILSLDKKTKTGYMLSIPRDLYVDIPGFGHAKINEAYQDGERSKFKETGYAKSGMGLLEKTVSKNFGVRFHYYVLINYGAVRDTVKALGGITVKIESRDPRGIYDPGFLAKEGSVLKLKNGKQKINAQQALNLTRARGKAYGSYGLSQSDFDRTKNQRAVIKGIKDKITWRLLLDPRKNKPLLDAVANNIKTDMGTHNILPFYRLFNSVPDNKLKSAGLRDMDKNINLLTGYYTPTGQSALIPTAGIDNFSEIQALIKRLNK